MKKDFDEDYLEEKAEFLHALAHPVRLKILQILNAKKACVTDLSDMMEIKQPNISQHLNILKNAGIIKRKRSGKMIHYKIMAVKTNELLLEIDHILKQ